VAVTTAAPNHNPGERTEAMAREMVTREGFEGVNGHG
jgi:hypothetical protein